MAKITHTQLATYAVDQLEAGMGTEKLARLLASFLLHERRTRESGMLYRAIEHEMDLRGSTQVIVTSAHTVSSDIKRQLATLLRAKNPVFDEVIDPSVIGGVKARAGESEIDLTVRSRLQKFKQQIITSN